MMINVTCSSFTINFYFFLLLLLFFLFYFFIYFFFLECRFNGEVGIFRTYMLKIFNPCVNPYSHFPSLRGCVWTGVQCGSKTTKQSTIT